MRQFLDQLPRVIATKPDPMRRLSGADATRQQPLVARALEATLHLRQATHHLSLEIERPDQDVRLIHPYRLAYAQGGLYLLAYVPEYGEVRTFAVERIQELSLLEERFTPIEELPDTAFPHSLGVHSGPPERVEIEFQPAVADYVRAREWHPSQSFADAQGGGVQMTLDVCLDRALHSWILSFGPFARVVAPEQLRHDVAEQLHEAGAQHTATASTLDLVRPPDCLTHSRHSAERRRRLGPTEPARA